MTAKSVHLTACISPLGENKNFSSSPQSGDRTQGALEVSNLTDSQNQQQHSNHEPA